MKKLTKNKKVDNNDPLAGDLTGYLSKLKWRKAQFIFAPKNTTLTLRVPQTLVDSAKKVAKKKGVKYQSMMRDVLADYLAKAA